MDSSVSQVSKTNKVFAPC